MKVDEANGMCVKVRRLPIGDVCLECGGDIIDRMIFVDIITPNDNIKFKRCRNCLNDFDLKKV